MPEAGINSRNLTRFPRCLSAAGADAVEGQGTQIVRSWLYTPDPKGTAPTPWLHRESRPLCGFTEQL